MSKIVLIILGVLLAVWGILALFLSMFLPVWLAIIMIVVGIICVVVGLMDKRKAA
ncbi:MAG: hypothetical protein PHQ09_02060 [Actinomycetota bacterium]|nr:hypothetical protein [Actinomycetota bacterium]